MKQLLKGLSLVGLTLALSGCGLFGDKDNTPKPSKLVKFTPSMIVSQQWDTSASGGSGEHYLKLGPAYFDKYIYVAGNKGELTGLSAEQGDELWDVDTKQPISAGPSAANGLVFVGTSNAKVMAFDALSGKKVWTASVPSVVLAAPTPTGDELLVKTIDGKLIAFDQETGKQDWTFAQDVPSLILRGSSPATDYQNYAIAGFANGKLIAVDKATGSQAWSQPIASPDRNNAIENMVDIDAKPLVKNSVVFVVTYQGYIAALNADTGTPIWHHNFSSYSGLAVDNNNVYATDADGYVWAFDQGTGNVLWVQKSLKYRNITGPAVMDGTVAVADKEGYIHWMSAEDGHFVARVNFDSSGVLANPIAVNNALYIVATNGDTAKYTLVKN